MNKKEAIKLFETQPWTFKDLSAELKKDKDVVIAAIKQSFYILEHVDPLFKKDKEIVLTAVKQNGGALEFADKSFRKDKKIILPLKL